MPDRDWERVSAGASFYQQRPYLAAVELDGGTEPRYFLARDADGRLLGALPAYFWDGEEPVADHDHFAAFVGRVDRAAERASWYPALLLGSRAGFLNDVLLDDRLAGRQQVETLAGLLHAAAGWGRARGVRSLAFPYLRRRALAAVLEAVEEPALALYTAAHARIDLGRGGFDGYLAGLSRSGRRTVRKDARDFEESGLRASVEPLGDWYERCAPLLANLQRRYGNEVGTAEATRFLAHRALTLGASSRLVVCMRGRELVAFSLSYVSPGDGLYVGASGYDYADRSGSPYFTLVYHRPIAAALEAGLSVVHVGVGSYEAKLIRGATLEPLWTVVLGEGVEAVAPSLESWNEACREIMEARFGRYRRAFPATCWRELPPAWHPA